MIIIMKPQATEEQIASLCESLREDGMQVQRNAGVDCTVLGVLGNVASLDPHDFLVKPGVERVMPVSEPFKKANRKFHPTDRVIDCGGVPVGGRKLAIFAGPCSVESRSQIIGIAESVKASGAELLRGASFLPPLADAHQQREHQRQAERDGHHRDAEHHDEDARIEGTHRALHGSPSPISTRHRARISPRASLAHGMS